MKAKVGEIVKFKYRLMMKKCAPSDTYGLILKDDSFDGTHTIYWFADKETTKNYAKSLEVVTQQ